MFLYRLAISLLAPVLAAVFMLRRLAGREDGAALAARLGRVAPGGTPSIWLHAASNGELTSVRALIDAVRAARPDLDIFVTCNTQTGRDLAQSWGVPAALAPLDLRWMARRLLKDRQVVAHLSVESELWPNRLDVCRDLGIPVAVVGARLSERTARGWARLPGLRRRVATALTLVAPQDDASAARLAGFGVPASALAPVSDLKASVPVWPAEKLRDAALDALLPRAQTWLAASTHEGEEDVLLAAHRKVLAARPGTTLILAPRHPRRAEEIAALVHGAGLSLSRRAAPVAGSQVFLADTMGEMPHWYHRAAVTFVAGSLSDRGGHTPHEPIAYDSAVLHGPHVANFRAVYADLDAAGAAVQATDAETIARAVLAAIEPGENARMARAARTIAMREDGVGALRDRLLALLPKPVLRR